MKTFKKSQTAIAALTNNKSNANNVGLAALTFTVGEINVDDPKRVQLLPDGYFKAKDGRPFDVVGGQWLMDSLAYELISDAASRRKNPFHFDYEHQTLNAEFNGQPAPASGWFRQMEYIEDEGLFALDVDWSEKAANFIANKEYKFVSAVFAYDLNTGRILEILHAALTNDPALDGMNAIEALKNSKIFNTPKKAQGEASMNAAKKLLASLGVDINSDADITDDDYDRASVALKALQTKADQAGQLEKDLNTAQQNVASLKASAGKPDMTQFVSKQAYDELGTAYAALKNGSDENGIEQLLKDNSAKIYGQADRDYLENVGKQHGVAALKAALEPRVAIAALTSTQTAGKKPADNPNDSSITAEDKQMADMMGVSKEDLEKYGA